MASDIIIADEMAILRERATKAATALGSVAKLSRATGISEVALSRFLNEVSEELHVRNYLRMLHWLDGKTPSL